MPPPIAVDVDGTMTRSDRSLDPRVLEPLRSWLSPVVIATGKALPYPVGLCEFIGLPITVIAENGGVVAVADELVTLGDRTGPQAVADAYVAAGHDLGWGPADFPNRWRETEVAVNRGSPLAPLEALASEHGLEVVDSGYAYHVKSPDVDKGRGLRIVADHLDIAPSAFVAVGDSVNDADAFRTAGTGIAVGNADEAALAAADRVTEATYSEGLLEALSIVRDR